jgi:hypothetical protein
MPQQARGGTHVAPKSRQREHGPECVVREVVQGGQSAVSLGNAWYYCVIKYLCSTTWKGGPSSYLTFLRQGDREKKALGTKKGGYQGINQPEKISLRASNAAVFSGNVHPRPKSRCLKDWTGSSLRVVHSPQRGPAVISPARWAARSLAAFEVLLVQNSSAPFPHVSTERRTLDGEDCRARSQVRERGTASRGLPPGQVSRIGDRVPGLSAT